MGVAGAGVLDRLKELGLSEYESRIYAALLRGGPAKVADLAVKRAGTRWSPARR